MRKAIDTLATCSRRNAMLALAGVAAQFSGCGGGGGGVAGLSTGGTGSFTSGTITGFGSIIVNGIRYNNDTAAVFTSDDASSSNAALQLGMVVTIEGSATTPATSVSGLPTATATRITFGSEWIGPVSNLGVASFEILGHTVDVLSSTIFSGAVTQLTSLTTAHYVEVYGYVNQTNGHIQASRIEVSTTAPNVYRLSGALTQINSSTQTALLDLTPLHWTTASVLPSGLAENTFVRVTLDTSPSNTGNGNVWNATRIAALSSPIGNLTDHQEYEAEILGVITAFNSTADFTVNGIPVNASSAQVSGVLAVGVLVEVEGAIRADQLQASQVSVQSSQDVQTQKFEFYGQVSNASVSTQSFVLRGQTFSYDSNTAMGGVNFAQTPTPNVEVKARRVNNGWYAYEIELQN